MLRPLGLFQVTGVRENEVSFPAEILFQIFLVLIFFLFFFFFFPPTYAISDESIYFSMAHVLSQGMLFPDQSSYFVPSTIQGTGHRVSYPPLGWPILLAPLSKLSWHYFFLLPLALHLIGFYYFRKILNLMGIDTVFSFLYLFFPTFIFHSRTLMSDLPAAVFFLIGFYYSIQDDKRPLILAGICFGISVWIRYASLVVIFPLIAILLLRNFQKTIYLLCGFTPFIILLAAYNYLAWGNPFLTGYDRIGVPVATSLSFDYFLEHFPKYFLILNIIYPLMGISLLFYKGKRRIEIYSCVCVLLLFYSARFWFDSGTNVIETAIKSLRFLLPIIPLLLLCYLYYLDVYVFDRMNSTKKWGIAIVSAICLSGIAFGIHHKHQEYLKRQKHFSDLIYKNTPQDSSIIANMEIIEMLQTVWGKRHIIEYDLSAITKAASENKADTYFVTNDKVERPEVKAQNSYFLSELRKYYSVNKISSTDERGWELSIYRVSKL
jgi:hypothetical protein